MTKLFSVWLFLAVTLAAEPKVVFALSTGKIAVLEKRLIAQVPLLAEHYAERGGKLKVAVVIYGDAYRFFVRDPRRSSYAHDRALLMARPRLGHALKKLHERYGVRYDICGMGMKKRRITPGMLYSFVRPVFNKNAALIDWQNRGYAYVEIR